MSPPPHHSSNERQAELVMCMRGMGGLDCQAMQCLPQAAEPGWN